MNRKPIAALTLLLISFGFLYYRVIARLVRDWYTDDNYSHGFLIVPMALYFVWERRAKFQAAKARPTGFGLLVVLGSLAALLAGILGSEFFLARISILGCIAGSLLFLYGWGPLKTMLFPITFLILMIPVPAIIFNHVAFPLQLFASRLAEAALTAFQIPILREGNVIQLASTSLEVAEACSGIRSLISLLTLGIVYGYFTDSRMWVRFCLALATIPVAILANAVRVTGTGAAAHCYGAAAAQGFFHSFSGWLIFVVAFVMLLALQRMILWLWPAKPAPSLGSVPAA